jgi:phosphoglycerate-specific signal transduction histidine kinase
MLGMGAKQVLTIPSLFISKSFNTFLIDLQGKSLYFVPWLTEQIIALCVGATTSLIMALGGTLGHVTVVGGVIMLLVFLLDVFFVYSIFSHFILLRRMKRHSKEIISSVMQGKGNKK